MSFLVQILSMLGAMILLFAWLTQQFLYERWNSRLNAIERAEGIFFTYQSNNALFNALFELMPENKQSRLRELQEKNYRLGLSALRKEVPEKQQIYIDARTEELENQYNDLGEMAKIQAELTSIQELFEETKKRTLKDKAVWKKVFWGLYIAGSILVLAGNVYKQ